jgi:membrane protein DedA with SNARE-associated domain
VSLSGRFFSPVRAVVPLAAGILKMPPGRFWLANILSACIWAPGVLFPGAIIAIAVQRFESGDRILPAVAILLALIGIAGFWLFSLRQRQ